MTTSVDPLARLDSEGVRSSFDRASATYEAAAVLQARVADELLERLQFFRFEPQVVLDLGAGTGRATGALKRRYRSATVVAVDLAVSSLMLQWCDDLDQALAEIRRVLKPDGFFGFTTFGPDTLRELRAAWATVDEYTHVNTFIDMHDIGDALGRAGFTEPVLDVERVTVTYPDVMALMRDLKTIGAHNVTAGRPRGLTGRERLRRMEAAYEAERRNGRIPATYEVIHGAAWGGSGRRAASAVSGEVRIPVGAIRRRNPA
jgi:malonyl-CoA O-methyltransferase